MAWKTAKRYIPDPPSYFPRACSERQFRPTDGACEAIMWNEPGGIGRARRSPSRGRSQGKPSQVVMPGLDPGIHRKNFIEEDGLPGHKRVYARLRRTMPGNDGGWACGDGHWYYIAAIASISSRKLGLASPRRMHSVLAGGCPAK